MRKIIEFSARYAWLVITLVAMITYVAFTQISALVIDVSPEGLMVRDHPDRRYYEKILEDFGSDNVTIVVVKDANLQDRERLLKIRAAVEALNALDFVERTESLYSVQYLRIVDDYVVRDPYLDVIPDDPHEIKALFDAASRNPFVIGNLLSEDRRSMAINVYLDDRERYPNFDREVAAAIEQAIRPLGDHVDEVFQIGLPYVRSSLEKTIVDDQKRLLPVSFAVLLITLMILVRSINSGIVPFVTSLTSIIWVLGFMGYVGIPVTLITSIVPILIIIIGSTEDVHLISEYLQARDSGDNKHAAIRVMAGKKGFAILITFITSYLGFISISVNRIEMLQEFGIVASSGLFLNFIVTVLLVPAWLSLFGSRKDQPSEIRTKDIFRPIINVFYHIVHRRKGVTLFLTIVLMLVAGFGASKIQLNNNVMGYFHEDSQIKVRANTVTRSLSGMETFMIVMDSGIEGTFLKARYLSEIAYLQTFIESTGLFDKTVSFADYMALLNSAVNDDSEIVLPEDDLIINEIQIFLKYQDIRQYISEDYSTSVIMVRHSLESSYELKHALQKLEKFVQQKIDSGIDVRFTGESILTNRAADEMAIGQAKSLLIMLFIIFIVISLLFFNTKAGLLAIIPNLVPIVVLFGMMGYFNIPLDTGTAMIAAISIGIVVDDTLHFMVRYNRNLKTTYDEEYAIGTTMREEATPIISTSVALALGFTVLSQSSFVPVVYFGMLSAMVMLMALLAEFLLTPILLASTRLVTLWDMMSLHLKDQLIRECRLFRDMHIWQIKKLILLSRIHEYKQGDMVMKAGDPANEMYILLDGSVDVCLIKENGERKVIDSAVIGRVFGVFQFGGKNVKREASALATEDSTVLIISWQSIERIARFYPRITSLFFKNLSNLLGVGIVEQIKGKVEAR